MSMLTDYNAAVTALETLKTNALVTPMPPALGERIVATADAALATLKADDERNKKRITHLGL
jgi:hypothetical protein